MTGPMSNPLNRTNPMGEHTAITQDGLHELAVGMTRAAVEGMAWQYEQYHGDPPQRPGVLLLSRQQHRKFWGAAQQCTQAPTTRDYGA